MQPESVRPSEPHEKAQVTPRVEGVDFAGELAGAVGKRYAEEERERRENLTERAIAKARRY